MRCILLLVVFVMGCAGTQGQDAAIRATNLLGVTLQHVDAQLAPVLEQELREADEQHPNDVAAYKQAVKAPLQLHEAFEDARDTQRWMHLAVEQWQSGEDGQMWLEVVPCAVDALDKVVSMLDAADTQLQVVRNALAMLGDGRACQVQP